MKAVYPVILEQEKDFIVVSVPDLAINTQGKDYFDAIAVQKELPESLIEAEKH